MQPWLLLSITAAGSCAVDLGWPETIELLTQQRTQAETCAGTLKSSGDTAAVATGRLTYGAAKAQADGIVAGFTVSLVQGGRPDDLPTSSG